MIIGKDNTDVSTLTKQERIEQIDVHKYLSVMEKGGHGGGSEEEEW